MNWNEYVDNLAFEQLGLKDYGGPQQGEQDLLLFNRNDAKTLKVREGRAWFSGDDNALHNFYSKNALINFHLEPFYWKNRRSFFWPESVKENDYKRTTSGIAPAIIWTLINIIGFPTITEGQGDRLQRILEADGFEDVFHDEMMPKTLSEGYGCFKISWDVEQFDHPTVDFVEAENVDFIKRGRRVVGVVFKEWFTDRMRRKYLIAEIRRTVMVADGPADSSGNPTRRPHLVINTRVFRVSDGDECQLSDLGTGFRVSVPELADIQDDLDIADCDQLLAEPCWFFKDPEKLMEGKPILQEKVSLLDDLDQSLSQSSNADRASTVQRVYDAQYLDRDPDTGLPLRPDKFNLKYTYSDSSPTVGSDGGIKNTVPIQVVQPSINFEQYNVEQMNLVTHILQGVVSPATMGIDVSRKDNANAQREKEKVTVFTRNGLIRRLERMLRSLCHQVMVCDDYLHSKDGDAVLDWGAHSDVAVKFSEFADTSFESRATILMQMMGSNTISPKQFVKRLYMDTMTKDEKDDEVQWLNDHFSAEAQRAAALGGAAMPPQMGGTEPGQPPLEPGEAIELGGLPE